MVLKLSRVKTTLIPRDIKIANGGAAYWKNAVPRAVVSVGVESADPISLSTEDGAEFHIDGVRVQYRWSDESKCWLIDGIRLEGREVIPNTDWSLSRHLDRDFSECPIWIRVIAEACIPESEDE